jgi:hypothetical protein
MVYHMLHGLTNTTSETERFQFDGRERSLPCFSFFIDCCTVLPSSHDITCYLMNTKETTLATLQAAGTKFSDHTQLYNTWTTEAPCLQAEGERTFSYGYH